MLQLPGTRPPVKAIQTEKCKACRKLHPTSLHGDFKENKHDTNEEAHSRGDCANSRTVNCAKSYFVNDGSHVRISSMIITVWIHHSDNPETERLVYALLDNQLDTAFVTHETLDSLNVSSPETQLRLSVMHAENEVIPSNKVKGPQYQLGKLKSQARKWLTNGHISHRLQSFYALSTQYPSGTSCRFKLLSSHHATRNHTRTCQ